MRRYFDEIVSLPGPFGKCLGPLGWAHLEAGGVRS